MKKLRITIGKKTYDVTVEVLEDSSPSQAPTRPERHAAANTPAAPAGSQATAAAAAAAVAAGAVVSPMAGVIKTLLVNRGDDVQAGDSLVILEAMKMENQITAPRAGSVRSIDVTVGQSVTEGQVLLTIE